MVLANPGNILATDTLWHAHNARALLFIGGDVLVGRRLTVARGTTAVTSGGPACVLLTPFAVGAARRDQHATSTKILGTRVLTVPKRYLNRWPKRELLSKACFNMGTEEVEDAVSPSA